MASGTWIFLTCFSSDNQIFSTIIFRCDVMLLLGPIGLEFLLVSWWWIVWFLNFYMCTLLFPSDRGALRLSITDQIDLLLEST